MAENQGNENELKCGLCGCEKLDTDYKVGSDQWEGGSEDQHVDHCTACGAWRHHSDVYLWENDNKPVKSFGKWHTREEWVNV